MSKKVMVLAGLLVVASAATLRAQQPTDAAATYARTCASCHGAKGTPSPSMAQSMHVPDFASTALASQTDDQLKNVVANGKGKLMPSYKTRLSAEQIASLVTYIRTFSKH